VASAAHARKLGTAWRLIGRKPETLTPNISNIDKRGQCGAGAALGGGHTVTVHA
jgi:hypothetical protein